VNWIRVLVRFALSFLVLYILGYVVPGFSGLTVSLLALLSIFIALVSALVERISNFRSKRQRALILLLADSAVIYLFTFAFVGRPPLVSTVFAAVLVSWVELLFPVRPQKERKMLP
jgi:hypothetical protein